MGPGPSTIGFRYRAIDADTPENPHIKIAGDITGSGSDDLVVPSSNGGPLAWYEAPNWERHVICPAGKWSCDAKLVDMDGDGDLDLLIPEWYTHDRLEWWENPLPDGDPRTDPWTRHIIGSPRAHDVCVGDIDGDGELEIVTRLQNQPGDHLVIRKCFGDEWRTRTVPCPEGEGLALGDVNGDGRPEAVIGGRWYEIPADPLEGEWVERAFAEWPPDAVVRLHDMNGNGRLDVVLTQSEGPHRLSWFEAPGDPHGGTWQEHVVEPSLDFAHSLVVCDLSGDGLPDIVTAEMHQSDQKRVMVYVNGGDADSWQRHVLAETGSHNMCVAKASDGTVTIVGANWSGPYQPLEAWERRETVDRRTATAQRMELQQGPEVVDGQARLADDRAERSAVQFPVVGNDDLCERRVAPHNHVAPLLTLQVEANLLQRMQAFPTGDSRQATHTATTMA